MAEFLSESEVQRQICDWLTEHHYFFFRLNNAPVFSGGRRRALGKFVPKGLPDIFVIHDGIPYAFEVKRPEGFYKNRIRKPTVTADQFAWGQRFGAAGGRYKIVTSVEEVGFALAD